ncbi:MAG: hypothetical protein ACOYXM_05960 [Actinomycetota bacterium]
MVGIAAANNAQWCDIVCRSHGLATRFERDAWTSATRTPPFYPDAVTLEPDARALDLLARIDGSAGCSIKDSFASLDLAPHGFSVLFDAEWVVLPPGADAGPGGGSGPRWEVVRDGAAFARWERAWRGAEGPADVLRAAVVDDDSVSVLAAVDGGDVVGGAVLNRTGDAVGISNVFAIDGTDASALWVGCVAQARAMHPCAPLVGYESGAALAVAVAHGFERVGPLRVWQRAG